MCADNFLSSITEDGTFHSKLSILVVGEAGYAYGVGSTWSAELCRIMWQPLLIVPLVTAVPLVQLATVFNWLQDCIFPCSPLIFSIGLPFLWLHALAYIHCWLVTLAGVFRFPLPSDNFPTNPSWPVLCRIYCFQSDLAVCSSALCHCTFVCYTSLDVFCRFWVISLPFYYPRSKHSIGSGVLVKFSRIFWLAKHGNKLPESNANYRLVPNDCRAN